MKVLIIRTSVGRGGADKITAWLYHKMQIAFPNDIVNLVEYYDTPSWNKGWKSIHLHQKTIKNVLFRNTFGFIKEFIILYKLLNKEKPDIIVNFGCRLFYTIFFLRFIIGFKLLVSERMDPYTMKNLGDRIRRFLYQKCDLLICQTEQAADFFNNTKKINIIPNPITNIKDKKWNLENTDKIIINIGRYDIKQKRQDVLLKAFVNVLTKYPDYKLMLIGFGPDKQTLVNMANELNISDKVHFMTTNDIDPLLTKSRVFAFSSDFEGIPNTVIEAMQIGVPIVSVNTSPGCIDMLLQSGNNGIITPLNNPEALAKGIMTIIENDDISNIYSEKAYASLYRFNEDSIAQQWKSAIGDCLIND